MSEVSDGVSLGVLEELVGFKLRRIQNHLSRRFYEGLDRRHVRPGGFSALALISANPGISQTQLAREMGFDKALIVGLLDSLETAGWAERRRSTEDRRRHELRTTPAGETALSDLLGMAVANEAPVREALTEGERKQLFGLLDKVYVACFSDDGEGD